MPNPTHYLVVDLEATCDEPRSFPRSETEIIEIGAVLVEARSLAPIREFQTFVRPIRHPRLTAFCTELTSITQDRVDPAPRFPAALRALRDAVADLSPLLCSWGRYDWNQLQQDAAFHGVALPFASHLDLKTAFSERLGASKRFGVRGALRRVGLAFEGTPHRGIDDARNIARLLPWALGRPVVSDGAHPRGRRRRPARSRHRHERSRR